MKTIDMLEAQMRKSTDLTRTQLVSMVASLRGELFALLGLVGIEYLVVHRSLAKEDKEYAELMLEDARTTMKFTEFAIQPDDMVDGGFDDSWMDDPAISVGDAPQKDSQAAP